MTFCENDNSILFFADYLSNFLTKHINDSFDISINKDKVVEKDSVFSCLVGIYFFDDIKLEITCKKEISKNGIKMKDEQFSHFIHNFVSDRIIFNTYTIADKVKISKYITDMDENKIFGVTIKIEPETTVNLIYDRF